jgi:Spy/CpxP family protein refolding chaperone
MRRLALVTFAFSASLNAASAQHQPYAGLDARPIKALSEQQIGDLKAGRGMGLALAAELNGYPGPMHVLELADRLGLTAEQRTRVQMLFGNMRAEAVPLGEKLVAQEAELDRQFSEKLITPASLSSATAEIGQTQGALRHAHLKYHLATLDILTPEQAQRYAMLRGYHGSHQQQHQAPRHHR